MKSKMTIDASQWKRALAMLAPVVSTKTSLPILGSVIFKHDAERDVFTMTASDSETWITLDCTDKDGQPWVHVIEDDAKDKFSEVAIPFAALKEAVGLLPSGQVLQVTFDGDKQQMGVNYGIGELEMSWEHSDTFPQPPAVAAKDEDGALCRFRLPAEQLLPMMSAAVESAAEDELRPVMNAVCLNVFHDKLVVVGTDGREMFKDVIETGVGGGWLEYATFGAGSSAALLITKRARKVLATAVTEGELTVTADTRLCEFRADGCRVVLRQIDGRYPNYESVIPKGEYSVTVSRDALRDALRRMQISADEDMQQASLRRDGQEFIIRAANVGYGRSGFEHVPIHETDIFLPDGFCIGFKISIAIGILDRIQTDNVVLILSDPTRPILYRPEDVKSSRLMLQMPMVLND
jgi:DNA polymerase-3 subunit beta